MEESEKARILAWRPTGHIEKKTASNDQPSETRLSVNPKESKGEKKSQVVLLLAFFGPKNAHISAKNQKIKNLVPAIVKGHETKVCAHFWPQRVIWC